MQSSLHSFAGSLLLFLLPCSSSKLLNKADEESIWPLGLPIFFFSFSPWLICFRLPFQELRVLRLQARSLPSPRIQSSFCFHIPHLPTMAANMAAPTLCNAECALLFPSPNAEGATLLSGQMVQHEQLGITTRKTALNSTTWTV